MGFNLQQTPVFTGRNARVSGRDYKGETVSSIGEERRYNPRLQVSSAAEYAEIMDNLNLANPKMMDVAVPANQKIGAAQGDAANASWALSINEEEPLFRWKLRADRPPREN